MEEIDLVELITGEISTTIGATPNLTSISPNYNSLSGAISSEICKLTFTLIEIDSNAFSCTVPWQFSDLTDLRRLFLDGDNMKLGPVLTCLSHSIDTLFINTDQIT
jgi:hypothetical protein